MSLFRLSDDLHEKLCLVLHVFRENNMPDDVFWYMIKPFFRVNMNDLCLYDNDDKKFTSIFEYGLDFKIKIRDKWNMLEMDLLKNTHKFIHKWNIAIGIAQKNKSGNLNIMMQVKVDTYIIFTFSDNKVDVYLFCIQFNKNFKFTLDDDEINNIIKEKAQLLFTNHKFCRHYALIELNHLKLLKQKFNIKSSLFIDC